MKTKKEIESLLKSYETRRDNLIKQHSAENNQDKCLKIYSEIIRYNLRIDTVKIILI